MFSKDRKICKGKRKAGRLMECPTSDDRLRGGTPQNKTQKLDD